MNSFSIIYRACANPTPTLLWNNLRSVQCIYKLYCNRVKLLSFMIMIYIYIIYLLFR